MGYFMSEKWLRKKIAEFGKVRSSYPVAALMHIYLGTLTLKDISEKAGLSLDTLHNLRTEPSFMRLVDTLKKECSREFREDLLTNDHLSEEYDSLAADFSILDEMVQMQIKVPLFTQLKDLSQSLKSRKTYGLKIDTSELMLFKRLFTFFIFSEKYARTLASKTLSDIKQVAEEIVWPALKMDMKETERLLSEPILTRERRLKELKARLITSREFP
ncbi:MAG: hypothetical protein AB1633_03785 [Elusimicrobiota bacterium]